MLFKPLYFVGLLVTLTSASIVPRAVSQGGTIVSPASDSDATAGQVIPFKYLNRNFCNSGYSLISVYLRDTPPTASDVTSSGTFTDFVHSFGNFLIPNFGLPAMSNPPPPPSTLTVPDLGSAVADGELYFSIIETFRDCPPDGHIDYGLSFTPVEYHGSS